MNKIKFLVIVLFSIGAFTACKKQLDLQPIDTFSPENAFITIEDVQQGVNGAYGRYGTYANDIQVSALMSDEAKLGADNLGGGALTYRYQTNSSNGDVIGGWSGYYALIDQVNRTLPYVGTVTATAAQEPTRPILRAQLLALRGIAYFGLLQSFSRKYEASDPLGVPIVLEPNPLAQPPRASMGDVMAQIESDLSAAKAALPTVTSSDFSDTSMNKINIAAYQARIALYKRDYDAAITLSSEVINSGIKPLVTGADYAGIWTDDNDNEVLFRIRYATSTAIGSFWTTTGGNILIAPSDKLVASFDPADIRLSTFIGNDAGDNYVNKFYESSRGGRVVDLKAARTAEMYLIRAEAYVRKASPDLASSAADLNLLRASRIFGYVDETFPNAAVLTTAIMDERFKELCFEGFRFFDLKRNSLPVERGASDASPAWQFLPATSPYFVLPIPNDEILANPNVGQNDGY